jgi:hypothetical protein
MKFPIYMVKGKVKVKFNLEQTTTAQGGGGEQRYGSTLFLTSALDGGGWSTPRSDSFTTGNHKYNRINDDVTTSCVDQNYPQCSLHYL